MDAENRTEDRKNVEDGVLYLHEMRSVGNTAQNGLAFDFSDNGACIYTQQHLSQSDTIKVLSDKFGDSPRKATVRWCKKLDENLFKVGLSFNGNSSDND